MSDSEKGGESVSRLPSPHLRVLGNAGPLGLYSFASTTFILSMFNVQARGVTHANGVVGMALAVGGLAQLLAGMWEFASGNTFGATAFSSYGGFWLSYAAFFVPGAGIVGGYTSAAEESNAIGIWLSAWFIITFLFLIGSTRINIGFLALFFFLDITFLLLMIGNFKQDVKILKVAGGFGILTAFVAYYCGTCQLLSKETSIITLPIGTIKKRSD